MAIRIERIKINRYGPLDRDFVLQSGAVNLVYGPNETGKTYIVESLINLLFRTGKKADVQWGLRGWDFGGTISVSGLGDKPVSFTQTSKKLEDYWEQDVGLPRDFSRLLVVKAGETLLAGAEDGVGRDILKNYLSGEGLLDDIEHYIPDNIRTSDIVNREIAGPQRGEVKKRKDLLAELKRINALRIYAEKAYASAEAEFLRKKEQEVKEQMAKLGQAKHYYAGCIHKKIKALQDDVKDLPDEEKLYKMLAAIDNFEKSASFIERKKAELEDLAGIEEDFRWIEKALELYRDFSSRAVKPPGIILMVLIGIALAGSGFAGYYNMTIPFLAGIAVLVILLVIYFAGMRRVTAASMENAEMRKLKDEYKERFKQELTDLAVLEVRRDSLRNDNYRASAIREELEKKLMPALKADETDLRLRIKTITGKELPCDEWRTAVIKLKDRRRKLGEDVTRLEEQLKSLTVREEEFVDDDPGITWDSVAYNQLLKEYENLGSALNEETKKLEVLKLRVAQETGIESMEWGILLTALEQKQHKAVKEYKQITAQILAGIQVAKVIHEYRAQENTRIEQGLKREELIAPLHAVTGCYSSIRHDDQKGLVLTSDEENEYSLAEISTGAREQIFLALRMGFSSIAMKGQPAFLILDDAFQHSDWLRRENLVDEVLSLEKNGWQIFYFTMDDHIRDLFLRAGKKLGDTFIYSELRR